jgi:hypothetical protein
MRATCQACGAEPGRSHPKESPEACDDGDRVPLVALLGGAPLELETVAAPPHPDALSASATSPAKALELAVPIAGATVVVTVCIAGVGALRNARPSRGGRGSSRRCRRSRRRRGRRRRRGGRRRGARRTRRTRTAAAGDGQADGYQSQAPQTLDRCCVTHWLGLQSCRSQSHPAGRSVRKTRAMARELLR